MGASWRPILSGERAQQALAIARAIADALGRGSDQDFARSLGPGLAGGHAGVALMHAYLDVHAPDEGHDDAAVTALDQALGSVESALTSAGLYSGFPGIAFAVAHLECTVYESRDLDDLEALDTLLHHVLDAPWSWDYDLVSGLVGMGVYALERTDSELLGGVLERVVVQLEDRAEPAPDGVGQTYRTGPELLPEHQRQLAPAGYYNLGLAHGVPGVIAFLAQVVRRGGALAERAAELLRRTMIWCTAQISPADQPSGLRAWLAIDQPVRGPSDTRAAWCYGDPGAAVALLQGARALGDAHLEAQALALGLRSARRPAEQCGVVDAGLCHGAAGLAHIFNRLYQATGHDDFAIAARHWYDQTMAMRKPGQGVAGYLAFDSVALTSKPQWIAVPGLLTGAAGVALALAAAATDIEPAWDRMLLCSLEPI